jgi:hypothetical protein
MRGANYDAREKFRVNYQLQTAKKMITEGTESHRSKFLKSALWFSVPSVVKNYLFKNLNVDLALALWMAKK